MKSPLSGPRSRWKLRSSVPIVSLRYVLDDIGALLCATDDELFGEKCRRVAEVASKRRIAGWLMRKATKASYPRIGRAMQRDHTTIIYYRDSVEVSMKQDPVLRARLARLLRVVYRRYRQRSQGLVPPPLGRQIVEQKAAPLPITISTKAKTEQEKRDLTEHIELASTDVAWHGTDGEHGTPKRFFADQNARFVAAMRQALADEARERADRGG